MAGGIQLAPLLTQMKVDLKSFRSDMDKVKVEAVGRANEVSKEMSKAAKVGDKMSGIGRKMTRHVTLPIVAAGTAAAKFSMDFESAFTGVRKTVDGTDEQFAQLEQGIRDMSKEMPQSAVEIAGVAEAAGQLGIKTENILSFTKTMVMLGDSTNMSSEQAATALARLANITQMPQDQFGQLGSVVVALGNNLATTESEIVDMGLRLAGAGKQVGMTEAQTLSLSGALSSVGIEAEMGGSAMSKVLIDMQLAVEKGGDSLNNFAKVAGMSGQEFQKAFKKDAAGALISFIKGLGEAQKHGDSAIKVLDDMGIKEVRMRDALLRAAGAGDLFNESMKIGTNAWKENTALTNEANQRYATTESKLKMMKNQIVDAGMKIGEVLLPHVITLTGKIAGLAEKFSNLNPGTQEAIVKTALFAATMGPLIRITGDTIGAFTKLRPVVSGINTVFKLGTPFLGKFFSKLGLSKAAGATASTALSGVGTAAGTAAGASGLGAMAASLGTAVLAAAPFVAAGAAIVGTGHLMHKQMSKEVVPSIDLFADKVKTSSAEMMNYNTASQNVETANVKISESTKKAVGAYMDLDKQSSQSVMNLYTNSNLSAAEITKFTNKTSSKFKGMSEQIVQGYEKQKNDSISMLQEQYLVSGELTSQEMAGILQKTNNFYTQKQQTTQQLEAQIQQILQNASDNHKQLKDSEVQTITQLQEKMRQNAVTSLSSSEIEQKVIMERLKSYSGRITTEQASETIRNAEQQRIKSVDSANRQYLETKAKIEYQRDVVKSLTKDQADKLIKEAGRQKNESINKANQMKSGVVSKIKSMNSETVNNVSTSTGKILTFWDTMMRKWNEWNPQPKKFSFTYMENKVNASKADGSKYNGLSYVPFDGYTARLHKGERVLTAIENRNYIQGTNSSKGVNVTNNFYGRVDSPYEVAKASKKVMRDLSFG